MKFPILIYLLLPRLRCHALQNPPNGGAPLIKDRLYDAWGEPIEIEFREDQLRAVSVGKDGRKNTPDDIVSSVPIKVSKCEVIMPAQRTDTFDSSMCNLPGLYTIFEPGKAVIEQIKKRTQEDRLSFILYICRDARGA